MTSPSRNPKYFRLYFFTNKQRYCLTNFLFRSPPPLAEWDVALVRFFWSTEPHSGVINKKVATVKVVKRLSCGTRWASFGSRWRRRNASITQTQIALNEDPYKERKKKKRLMWAERVLTVTLYFSTLIFFLSHPWLLNPKVNYPISERSQLFFSGRGNMQIAFRDKIR